MVPGVCSEIPQRGHPEQVASCCSAAGDCPVPYLFRSEQYRQVIPIRKDSARIRARFIAAI